MKLRVIALGSFFKNKSICIFKKLVSFYLFLVALCGMWDLSSLSRD